MLFQFKNVQRAYRKKLLHLGVDCVSHSEMKSSQATCFRTREFEQMEMEFFCEPGTDMRRWKGWFSYWNQFCMDWILSLGGNKENLRFRDHEKGRIIFLF